MMTHCQQTFGSGLGAGVKSKTGADPTRWALDYPPSFPIAVDLDGTLFPYHVLWHRRLSWRALAQAAIGSWGHSHPWAWFKDRVATDLWKSPDHPWPLHQPLLRLLTTWKEHGCRLLLVTGAPGAIAQTVARTVALFDEVWHSTSTDNLVGKTKAKHLVSAFGHGGYTYIGDSWQDPPVWKHAQDIGVVNAPDSRLVHHVTQWKRASQRLAVLPHPCQKGGGAFASCGVEDPAA